MTDREESSFHPGSLPRKTILALLVLFVFLFPITRPEDPDVWFHLSVGRHLWNIGEYPSMDRFLFTIPEGTPSSSHEWLFQALIYPLYHTLGMGGVVAAKTLLIGASFLFVFFTSVTRRTFYPALAFFLVAFAAGSGRFYIRPEVIGAFILVLMWHLISRPLTLTRILTIAGLQVIWTNIHWSSILGPAVMTAYAAANLAGPLLPSRSRWTTGTSAPHPLAYPLLLVAALVATLCNPDFFRPFIEPFRYIFVDDFLLPIAEVLPTHRALFRGDPNSFQLWYFGALCLGALSFAFTWRKINLAHLFVFVGLAFVSLSAERHVLFFALMSIPIVAANLENILARRSTPPSRLGDVAAGLAFAFILTTLTMNKVTGITYLVPYPKPYEPLSADASAYSWPHRAAEFLLEEELDDRIFNNFNSGNFLNWAIFPRKIYINGTLTHRPTEEEYAWIKNHPEEWDSFSERMGINTVFLRLTPIIVPAHLTKLLIRHPSWTLAFYDGAAAIFTKNTVETMAETNLQKELEAAIMSILSDGGKLTGIRIPLWREVVTYLWRQDLARLFRLRTKFYLMADRPDLAEEAALMVRNLEGR